MINDPSPFLSPERPFRRVHVLCRAELALGGTTSPAIQLMRGHRRNSASHRQRALALVDTGTRSLTEPSRGTGVDQALGDICSACEWVMVSSPFRHRLS